MKTKKTENLKIEIETIALADVKEAKVNPQRMNEKDFARLVESIRRDGALSSAVLLNRTPEGLFCISGHHRIRAAIKAGLSTVPAMVTDNLPKSTAIRLQLQHNDIHGEPDGELARMLQMELSIEDLELVDAFDDLTAPIKGMEFAVEQEMSVITMSLVPETGEQFMALILDTIGTDAEMYLLGEAEYEAMKSYLTLAYKRGYKVTGRAISKMVEVVMNHLDELGKDQ